MIAPGLASIGMPRFVALFYFIAFDEIQVAMEFCHETIQRPSHVLLLLLLLHLLMRLLLHTLYRCPAEQQQQRVHTNLFAAAFVGAIIIIIVIIICMDLNETTVRTKNEHIPILLDNLQDGCDESCHGRHARSDRATLYTCNTMNCLYFCERGCIRKRG